MISGSPREPRPSELTAKSSPWPAIPLEPPDAQRGAAHWGGTQDSVRLAFVVNGISSERCRFLAAGGLGVLAGDGQLMHAGNEQIAEAYYELRGFKPVQLALDVQRVQNPSYNRDRGPAIVLALRFHVQL